MSSDLDKVRDFLRGVAGGDAELATTHIDPDRYVEHDPAMPDGAIGFWRHVDSLPKGGSGPQIVRLLEDGEYAVVQHRGDGAQAVFEAFRFDDGLIVEHWRFQAPAVEPNRSGHTQADGPAEPRHLELTEANKCAVRDYYETVHIGGRHDEARRWFLGDLMIRHEPGVADGGEEFLRDLAVITRDRSIDTIRLLAGQGDLVFLVAEGTHRGGPCAYVDLYRVEQCKLVEHWGFPQPFAPAMKERNKIV